MEKCKGTRDLLPQDMRRFRHAEGVFRDCCQKWGYREIRTPTLEYLHLFTSAGTLTPGMLSRVYSFLDWDGWSGERVVMRPEGTIPAARLYLDSLRDCPLARLFYVENIFAFEETGSRERWQCGAELIGGASPLADVELAMLALDVLAGLGLGPLEMRLSHAGLLRALLEQMGLKPEEQARVFGRILEGEPEAIQDLKARPAVLRKAMSLVLELRGSGPGYLRNLEASLARSVPQLQPHLKDFMQVAEMLSQVGCSYVIDMSSARGFEYYTGVIFQFYLSGRKLGGGGRYDDLLAGVGGRPTPASGFALYLDEMMALVPEGALGTPPLQIEVRADTSGGKGAAHCFEVMRLLRDAGYQVELDLGVAPTPAPRWSLLLRGAGLPLLLTDRQDGRSVELANSTELLKLLEREAPC